jgi:hypothetical protein
VMFVVSVRKGFRSDDPKPGRRPIQFVLAKVSAVLNRF